MLDHHARGGVQDLVRGGGVGYGTAECVEKVEAPVGEHAGGGFGDRVEHAQHLAIEAANRAVAEGEIGPLRAAVAVDHQREVFDVHRFARQGTVSHAANVGPGFLPHVAEGDAKGQGLAPENLGEGIVVEGEQVRAPEYGLRKARGQAQGHGGLQRIGPMFQWAQGGVGPVVVADAFGHQPAAV
ncbi:hypothetical protein D3C80_1170850 [compost metagenome]